MAEQVVQLHFGRYVHPVYREQLHAVPEGWRYESAHPALADATTPTKRIVEQRSRLAPARTLAERVALRVLSEAGYVHRVKASPLPGGSLIHSCERLLRRAPLPYVVDLEHVELFVLYQRAAFERPWARSRLERALRDERLRFLLPWSDAARRSVLEVLSPPAAAEVARKMRVVTPAIRAAVERPRARSAGEPLRVLFVGTAFYEKGAVEAIRAVQRLRTSHDLTLDMVSYAPSEWRARLAAEPGITVHAPGGADLVRRLYAQADVLLFPSHMDTFGYVVLEAMAHGIPALAPRHLALTETIADGHSGLLFPAENMLYRGDTRCAFRHVLPPPRRYLEALREPSEGYVDGIAEALGRVAGDPALHARLAEGALESVRSGPLSIDRRRAALAEVYESAAGRGP
jgi:glycosyltransferase involved in cell wall biosynthesis